jgi:hypothetical protein
MFQPLQDDGRCPDQACRKPLKENDYSVGICSACDGVLPAKLLTMHAEKIEKMPAISGK